MQPKSFRFNVAPEIEAFSERNRRLEDEFATALNRWLDARTKRDLFSDLALRRVWACLEQAYKAVGYDFGYEEVGR